jgi:putative spermidine/putrescine transport system ATP-binding protein/putrescine transport system ATP-binding protein
MGRTNWLEGRVAAAADGRSNFETASGWVMPVETAAAISGRASLCVRPESVEMGSHAEAPPLGATSGKILEVVPLGPLRQIAIEIAGGIRLLASEPNRAGAAPVAGARVSVSIKPEAGMLFPHPA